MSRETELSSLKIKIIPYIFSKKTFFVIRKMELFKKGTFQEGAF